MSYLVLARKWRPQTFDDMTGQEHVVRTVANAIKMNRVAHAYLFCGPRGVGKTTAARLLAKALNCEKGPTSNPCGQCQACLEIAAGTSVDVAEIDGASNNGVENVRGVQRAPQDAGGAARPREVHLRDHRGAQAPGHHPLALPAP
jgi:DNA polymerase-3 subunit gamma/tau